MAERLATVSSSDSPLAVELTATFRWMTSAERRLAAISKVVRVRVEPSKNRLNTLLPRSSGTFLMSRSVTTAKASAVSRIWTRSSRGSPSMERRCCSSPLAFSCGLRGTLELQGKLAAVVALQAQPHAGRDIDPRARVVRADGRLPAVALGEHDQRDGGRPPVVEQLVDRRAHRAPGIEHVVHQQQVLAGDVERDLRALGIARQTLAVVIVAVERDVEQPQGLH